MQLYLPFDYQESPKKPLTEQDFLHISEFEQGNFSNLICSRFTAEEIATILLQSETTLPDLKKTLLKQRCFNVRRLDVELNEKYKEYVKIHNDRVRTMLRKQYASEDPSRLADRGFNKFRKYNNFYWDFCGGKSVSKMSVSNDLHEWHDKYIKEKELYLKESISLLYSSNNVDRDALHAYYMDAFGEDEYKNARDEYFRETILTWFKDGNNNPQVLRRLYTTVFGKSYCMDSLESMQILDKDKLYLKSLWTLPSPEDIGSTVPVDTQNKHFSDPVASLLYQHIDQFEAIHLDYLHLWGAKYREMLISMELSESQRGSIFRQFLTFLSSLGDRKQSADLFICFVNAVGQTDINAIFTYVQNSNDRLSQEQEELLHSLVSAYLSHS